MGEKKQLLFLYLTDTLSQKSRIPQCSIAKFFKFWGKMYINTSISTMFSFLLLLCFQRTTSNQLPFEAHLRIIIFWNKSLDKDVMLFQTMQLKHNFKPSLFIYDVHRITNCTWLMCLHSDLSSQTVSTILHNTSILHNISDSTSFSHFLRSTVIPTHGQMHCHIYAWLHIAGMLTKWHRFTHVNPHWIITRTSYWW